MYGWETWRTTNNISNTLQTYFFSCLRLILGMYHHAPNKNPWRSSRGTGNGSTLVLHSEGTRRQQQNVTNQRGSLKPPKDAGQRKNWRTRDWRVPLGEDLSPSDCNTWPVIPWGSGQHQQDHLQDPTGDPPRQSKPVAVPFKEVPFSWSLVQLWEFICTLGEDTLIWRWPH